MPPDATARASVPWERADAPPAPVAERVPYLEVKLDHPDLDATHVEDGFFPDAVPYDDGETCVHYWRAALPGSAPSARDWTGVCATTHGLCALSPESATDLPLLAAREAPREVVVDGTVGGDATTALVCDYDPPAVAAEHLGPDDATVRVDGDPLTVPVGERVTHTLPEQSVRPAGDSDFAERATVTPHLHVRYPGERTLVHPEPGSQSAVFPSFDLSPDALPNPLSVPTAHGELDHGALAETLGVTFDGRPYPQRVLWQALAYTAFDPHRERPPRLDVVADLLVVANP